MSERSPLPASILPESDQSRTVTRGILIALIVVGHNKLFHNSYYAFYVALYSFHVMAFMIVPFLYPPRSLDKRKVVDLFIRYMVPFFVTTIFYSIVFFVAEVPKTYLGILGWIGDLVGSITFSNAYFVKHATGFEMLWFLPAFTVLTYLHITIYAGNKAFRRLSIILAAIAHCCVGLLPADAIRWVPYSAYISVYVLGPGLILSSFRDTIERFRLPQFFVIGLVFLVACFLQHRLNATIILSDFTVFSLKDPSALVITDVQMLGGTLLCVGIGKGLRTSAAFGSLGALSMKIYLIHGLVGYAIYRLYLASTLDLPAAVAMLATVALTLATSYAIAVMMTKWRAFRWVFPRGMDELRLTLRAKSCSTGACSTH